MLWSGGAATPHPVVQQGEAHPEQGDTRHALRRHVVPEPPPRTSERDRIWTGGDCGPNGVRRGRAGVGRPWSDTAGVPTGRPGREDETDRHVPAEARAGETRRQLRGAEELAKRQRPDRQEGLPRPPFPAGEQPADTPTPDLQGPLHAGPERRRKTGRGPAPRPPHRTPRGTHILHLTHSSTNMFPWSSASLSLWEERPGAAVGSPDPEASGLAPSPPPPGSPP